MDGEGSHYDYIHASDTTEHIHQKLFGLLQQFGSTIRADGTCMVRCGVIFCFAPRAQPFTILVGDLAFCWHGSLMRIRPSPVKFNLLDSRAALMAIFFSEFRTGVPFL